MPSDRRSGILGTKVGRNLTRLKYEVQEANDILPRSTKFKNRSRNGKKGFTSNFPSSGRLSSVDHQRWSFLVVIFFFALFTLIVIMSNFGDFNSGNNTVRNDEEYVGGRYGNFAMDRGRDDEAMVPLWDLTFVEENNGEEPYNKVGEIATEVRAASSDQGLQTDWQQVIGTTDKLFVYSAYFQQEEKSSNQMIRIMASTKTATKQKIFCKIYDDENRLLLTVPGRFKTIRENWNMKYSASFIFCPLSPMIVPSTLGQLTKLLLHKMTPAKINSLKNTQVIKKLVHSVTLSPSTKNSVRSNVLRITKNPIVNGNVEDDYTVEKHAHEFTVCVKPMHFNYDNVMQFVEWSEFYRLMGVTSFILYNHTIGPRLDCLLRSHPYNEIFKVLPWNLPLKSQKEIRTEGLFSALNDCVYRSRGVSKYLILVDFDEFIVLKKNFRNYHDFMDDIIQKSASLHQKLGAFSFQNVFFYLQWRDHRIPYKAESTSPLESAVTKELISLRKLRRNKKFHPHKQRSKYIAIPEKVVEAGNHFVWEMTPGYRTLSVTNDLASLHHYRVCEFGGNDCVKNPSVIDLSVDRFRTGLIAGVVYQLVSYLNQCRNLSDATNLFRLTANFTL